jgi:hypothetical protein
MVALAGLPGLNQNFPALSRFISACLWPIGLSYTVVCYLYGEPQENSYLFCLLI